MTVRAVCDLKSLDSGFRRNDEEANTFLLVTRTWDTLWADPRNDEEATPILLVTPAKAGGHLTDISQFSAARVHVFKILPS